MGIPLLNNRSVIDDTLNKYVSGPRDPGVISDRGSESFSRERPLHDFGASSGAAPLSKDVLECSKPLSHATTVFGIRLADNHLLLGVDSKSTIKVYVLNPNTVRGSFDITRVGNSKLKEFDGCGVFATVIGNSNRFIKLCEYVESQIKDREMESNFVNIRNLASEFTLTQDNPPPINAPEEVKVEVHMIGWIPQYNRYEVYKVKDGLPEPELLTGRIFGGGSGFPLIPTNINCEGTLMYQMLRVSAIDPFTGGELTVWSLKDNQPKHNLLNTSLVRVLKDYNDELCDSLVFDPKNMFVIVSSADQEYLSPTDFLTHLQQFFVPWMGREHVQCLHLAQNFVLYLVKFPTPEMCRQWFDAGCYHPANEGHESCHKNGELGRVRCFQNLDLEVCRFALVPAYPKRAVLFQVESFLSLDDFAVD